MDLPQPPVDQELKNIIDKLAQFVARNGPEFEHMTKQKQKDNPKFSFLFGGAYFHYYQYRVTTEQAILKQKQRNLEQQALVQQAINRQSIQTAPWQQHLQQLQDSSAEQIRQSEQNLAAQHQLLLQQQQVQVDEIIRKAQEDKLLKLSIENELDLKELNSVLQPIIDSCTKDSISTGKVWIFAHATNPQKSEVVVLYVLKKVTEPGATFEAKLHLVYLINDVLHHCFRKNADDLKKILEKAVVPIFCSTSIGVDTDKQQKLAKLHKIWETNKYFSPQILEQLLNPAASLAGYQAGLIAEFAALITPITTAIQTQYALLQKQHNDFVAHLTGQLQQMQTPAAAMLPAAAATAPSAPYVQQQSYDQAIPSAQTQVIASQVHAASDDVPKPLLDATASPATDPAKESELSPKDPMDTMDESSMDKRPSDPRIQTMRNPPDRTIRDVDRPMPRSHPMDYPPDEMMDMGYDYPPDMRHPNGRDMEYMDDYAPPYRPPPYEEPEYGLTPPHMGRDFRRGGPPFRDIPPMDVPPDYIDPIQPPYYDLPAGLMVPLVKLEDCEYDEPLDPDAVHLPPPALPTEALLAAVEQFYYQPERRGNSYVISSEGWEQLGLYEFFKAKAHAKKQRSQPGSAEDEQSNDTLAGDSPAHRDQGQPPRASKRRYREFKTPPKDLESPVKNGREADKSFDSRPSRRSNSRSPDHTELPPKSSSRSPTPPRSAFQRSRGQRSSRSRSRSPDRKRRPSPDRRSVSPPSFVSGSRSERLDESNKGHQLLKKMGWSGAGGLGSNEQGIQDPVNAGDVRDRQDMYKGIGISLNDPFENFRKSKGQAFINRMKARAEELGKN